MIPTTHPVSLLLQGGMVVLEFWTIGQFHKHPLHFTLGMVVLNVLAFVFYMATGSYILAPVCIAMGARHAANARRIYRHQLATRRQEVVAALEA